MNFTVVFSIMVLLTVTAITVTESASAQTDTGLLTLDSIPSKIKSGDTVIFSGKFVTVSGYTIPSATIYIKDDVSFGRDKIIGTVTTDKDGKFRTSWKATQRSSGSYDFYAIYEGNDKISKSRSQTYAVSVISGYSSSISSNHEYSTKAPTRINLDMSTKYATFGQAVTFSGKLTSNGEGLGGATIYIKEEDKLDTDDTIRILTTDINGKFRGIWNVKDLESGDRKLTSMLVDFLGASGAASASNSFFNMVESSTLEVYAQYKGDSNFAGSKTCHDSDCRNKVMTITDNSIEKRILAMALGAVIPGGDYTLDLLPLANSVLNDEQLSQSDYDKIESHLQTAFAKELGIDASDLSMIKMVAMLENPDELQNFNIPKTSDSQQSSYTVKPPKTSDCDGTDYKYDHAINNLTLDPNWYQWYTICSHGELHYSFSTYNSQDGFLIYILPPETDVDDFINDDNGSYYTCEEYKQSWHKKSNTCYIESGSKVVLHNDDEKNAIRVTGWIRN